MGGYLGDDGVFENTSGMNDGAEPVWGRDIGQQHGEFGGVAGIAGGDGDVSTEAREVLVQFGGARGVGAATRDQQ
ncbi:hypothetical protein MSIMFB_03629 [Mycobacterium simulans]|uniref:Uncharacterized protein n=1 Tax=Mycobacterium simulans TaxID=627089 RepID=A0A7Z7NAS6_9MYCO|nr:hypothetical protein MSIMFB_03629 [Mycobacterium simulans]